MAKRIQRPAYSEFSPAATDTENAAFTEGPYSTFAIQSFPLAPTYAASQRFSIQLVMDAFKYPNVTSGGFNAFEGADPKYGVMQPPPAPVINGIANAPLDQLVASALGEALGRAFAPVVQAAVYSMLSTQGEWSSGNSGGYLTLGTATPVVYSAGATTELSAGTISLETASLLPACLDSAYLSLPDTAYYMTPGQFSGIVSQVDNSTTKHLQVDPGTGKRTLFGYPVILTSQATAAQASAISGPVFGSLQASLTNRVVDDSLMLLRSFETYAEYAQVYYRSSIRTDIQTRDSRALVGVRYSTS